MMHSRFPIAIVLLMTGCSQSSNIGVDAAVDSIDVDTMEADAAPDEQVRAPDAADQGMDVEDATDVLTDPATKYCSAMVQLLCEGNMSCCTDPTRRHTDLAACMAGQVDICLGTLSGEAVQKGLVTIDENGLKSSLATLGQVVADCKPLTSLINALAEGPIIGTLNEGQDCTPTEGDNSMALACKPGLRCLISGNLGGISGTCRAPVAEGGSCAEHAFSCAEGFYCDDTDHCVATLDDGQPCTLSSACRSRFCDHDAGTCGAAQPTDDPWCWNMQS